MARRMRFIVITSPDFFPQEASLTARLFSCGIDVLHLRKPGAAYDRCAALIDEIREACRRCGVDDGEVLRRIVVHDHHVLCRDFSLRGVHLNSRNPEPPAFITGGGAYSLSASCHSLEEAERRKQGLDYVFLSPVFDSISKQDYRSGYSRNALSAASQNGIIDEKVIALGGVTADGIPLLRSLGFGGAAFLGDIWSRKDDEAAFVRHAERLSALLR